MSITTYFAPISEGTELILSLLKENYFFDDKALLYPAKALKELFIKMKDSTFIIAEHPYVDKVFRDSYYNYFSTKLNPYKRDCIRLSFFNKEICFEDFRLKEEQNNPFQDSYLGFMVIRPTESRIIGRNVISPRAFKKDDFITCKAKIQSTVNGMKFHVDGFPHSSQDEETISCAETTLWALMEYFSSRYAEYKPVLPSKIISTLNSVTMERQLPSNGLNVKQISYALREFGFGTRIYSKDEYKADFNRLISCYIESGIPLIIAMDNKGAGGKIGHALICSGHEIVADQDIDALQRSEVQNDELRLTLLTNGISYYDWNDIPKKFIFIDDNFPPYKEATLDRPAQHYPDVWRTCKINYFIAPLYPKIYLEAYVAKSFVNKFLIQGPVPIHDNSELLIKFFLTSSRSYKDSLTLNNPFYDDLRDVIIETPMPKFIWIAELSTKELIKQGLANGLVILDATEANTNNIKPLIFATYQDNILTIDKDINKVEINVLPLHPFKIYTHNLRRD
jgi:hypothetical protein